MIQIQELEAASFDEARLLIDAAMRPGESLSMAADFPLLVGPEARARRLIIRDQGRIVAHAAGRLLRVMTPAGRSFGLYNIGAVCTSAQHRGQGHASRLVAALLNEARLAGVEAAILWAEVEGFYEKLGFRSAGLEARFLVDPQRLAEGQEADVWPLRQAEIPALAALRRNDAFPIKRSDDEARILFNIPLSETRVALEKGKPVAYATLGKGLDFQGVVCEWGGIPELIPALVRALMREFDLPQAMILGPGWDQRYLNTFAALGFEAERCDMAMMQVLDAERLAHTLQPHCDSTLSSSATTLLAQVFGSTGAPSRDTLLPFYVWGLDSV